MNNSKTGRINDKTRFDGRREADIETGVNSRISKGEPETRVCSFCE